MQLDSFAFQQPAKRTKRPEAPSEQEDELDIGLCCGLLGFIRSNCFRGIHKGWLDG